MYNEACGVRVTQKREQKRTTTSINTQWNTQDKTIGVHIYTIIHPV